MKRLKTCAVLLIMALILQFTLLSCEKENKVAPKPDEVQLSSNLFKSQQKYQEVINARTSLQNNVKFTIKEVSRDEHLLQIKVEGGCREEAFNIIWDGSVAYSYPAQVHLVLTHEATNENCQDALSFSLSVDLTKLLGEDANLEDYQFRVANGAEVQDLVLDGNTTVSND